MIHIACSLSGIFDGDEKYFYYKVEELAETVFKIKLNIIVPLIFAWAKKYDDVIVLTLYLITKNKRCDPDIALAIELFLCLSWFMETRKISFEGVVRHTTMQLMGKFFYYFGEKLMWRVNQYATILIIFSKYFPQLHVPTTIPKNFDYNTQLIFNSHAEFISNMLKGLSTEDVLTFMGLVHKSPVEDISREEQTIFKYYFYYFTLVFKKHSETITDEEIMSYFAKWDVDKKGIFVLEDNNIHVSNINHALV